MAALHGRLNPGETSSVLNEQYLMGARTLLDDFGGDKIVLSLACIQKTTPSSPSLVTLLTLPSRSQFSFCNYL